MKSIDTIPFFYRIPLGNRNNKSMNTRSKQADVKPTSAELKLERLRIEYLHEVKKNQRDRDRLKEIKRGLEKAYQDLEELRQGQSK